MDDGSGTMHRARCAGDARSLANIDVAAACSWFRRLSSLSKPCIHLYILRQDCRRLSVIRAGVAPPPPSDCVCVCVCVCVCKRLTHIHRSL